MSAPTRHCPVCNGRREWFKLFPHPKCISEPDVVVKATCMECNRPGSYDDADVACKVHHEVVGKVDYSADLGRARPQGDYFGFMAGHNPEKLVAKKYDLVKRSRYTVFFRKVKWDNTKDYPITIDGFCPIGRK